MPINARGTPDSNARECPECGLVMVVRVLDVPTCQSCDWAGAIPVDDDWKPTRA